MLMKRTNPLVRLAMLIPVRWLRIESARIGFDCFTYVRITRQR